MGIKKKNKNKYSAICMAQCDRIGVIDGQIYKSDTKNYIIEKTII